MEKAGFDRENAVYEKGVFCMKGGCLLEGFGGKKGSLWQALGEEGIRGEGV